MSSNDGLGQTNLGFSIGDTGLRTVQEPKRLVAELQVASGSQLHGALGAKVDVSVETDCQITSTSYLI